MCRRTSLAAHRMSSYRRALIHARRNEGLLQFRQWVADQIAAGAGVGEVAGGSEVGFGSV